MNCVTYFYNSIMLVLLKLRILQRENPDSQLQTV
jgi:hypothetical protein